MIAGWGKLLVFYVETFYVYIERDIPNRSNTIHTSSSCPRIDKAYSVNETKFYTYTPYVDRFCKRCMYESDVIK